MTILGVRGTSAIGPDYDTFLTMENSSPMSESSVGFSCDQIMPPEWYKGTKTV